MGSARKQQGRNRFLKAGLVSQEEADKAMVRISADDVPPPTQEEIDALLAMTDEEIWAARALAEEGSVPWEQVKAEMDARNRVDHSAETEPGEEG